MALLDRVATTQFIYWLRLSIHYYGFHYRSRKQKSDLRVFIWSLLLLNQDVAVLSIFVRKTSAELLMARLRCIAAMVSKVRMYNWLHFFMLSDSSSTLPLPYCSLRYWSLTTSDRYRIPLRMARFSSYRLERDLPSLKQSFSTFTFSNRFNASR